MNKRITLFTGALLAGLAVILGALGAHGLHDALVNSGKLSTYELANRYHFYHALALIICGLIMTNASSSLLRYASLALLIGVFLFSGSLYLLCFYKFPGLGPATPLGGLFLIIGWISVALAVLKK